MLEVRKKIYFIFLKWIQNHSRFEKRNEKRDFLINNFLLARKHFFKQNIDLVIF